MSITYSPATIMINDIENEPTEGWTLTPTPAPVHDDGWGNLTTANRPDSWENQPVAPSPPLSAINRPTDYASMHWTACYDDYCRIHRHAKNNNYYPYRAEGPCRHRNSLQYRVEWTSFHDTDKAWYPASNFENSPDVTRQFHLRYPAKPSPPQ